MLWRAAGHSANVAWLVNDRCVGAGVVQVPPQLHPFTAMLQLPRHGRGVPHLAIPEQPIQASCSASPTLSHVQTAARQKLAPPKLACAFTALLFPARPFPAPTSGAEGSCHCTVAIDEVSHASSFVVLLSPLWWSE